MMRLNILKITGALAAVFFFLSAFKGPKIELTDRIKSALKTYRNQFSPEKIYIQHDKPHYMAGEILWLKAYVLDAASLKASTRSGVLYIDFLNDRNEAVKNLTLPIADGESQGDFIIPENLPEGIYTLSAYTRWMRNFGEEDFFQKEIYILDTNQNQLPQNKQATQEVDIQFFPESGDLIAGISNEVAFKVIDLNGLGVPVSGSLYDERENKILEFDDSHLGMGSFVFTPEKSQRYTARFSFNNGQKVALTLPEILATGIGFHVDEVSDEENILIKIATPQAENIPLLLTGIGRDTLVYSEKVNLNMKSWETKISKADFPTGITRFTLSQENGEPLAERLVFIRHPRTIEFQIKTDKAVYLPREKVNVSMQIQGQQEEPPIANISISVTADALIHRPKYKDNIQSYLLLSSDLKGHIESPGYYFESENIEPQMALRHLMMTQGWRRFGWNDLITQNFPKIQYANEMDLTIRGRLVRTNGKPVADGEVLLYLKDQHQTFISTTTDDQGYFTFRGFYFKGNIEVVIQGSDHRGRRDDVEVQIIEKDFVPVLSENRITLPQRFFEKLPEDYVQVTQEQFQAVETEVWGMELSELLLKEIVVEGRAKIHEPFKLHQQADVTVHREQLPVAPSGNILESLQGRVPGLQINRTGMNEFRAFIRGQSRPPLYLLDGMPISESTLQSINQFDIGRIEILKSPAATGIYGGRAGAGVIALFTEVGYEEVVEVEDAKYIVVEQISGFDRTRQFYSPKYETTEYYDLPDKRSTIYWNPMISIRGNNNKEISFYTGDTPGIYSIIIEGMTKDGQPVRKEYSFEVSTDGE